MSEPDRTALLSALPYARRLARALTGSQAKGDAMVADALRGGVSGAAGEAEARLALFAAVARVAGSQPEEPAAPLTRTERLLLLLTSLEELDLEDAAGVLGLDADLARAMLASARERLRAASAARVLIIEDEPIIAMDLQQLVESAGHEVVGLAASEAEAVALADRTRPTLVLADVNLGHGGDGATAVERILSRHAMPVIFVTAYPERLLTGSRVEPAFVITKPFEPTTLAVATFQAVTRGVPIGAG
ncbi:PhyR family response regulator anti-anti-sigma factor [Falsiroseomonas oryziterrae]|uniref:PhyR family response regulator anti-anti-sigma factor n=1 Tax=Falsiroseomonas oryziterrae TaxID=2911368 RepID=UPI001F1C7E1C|nr:response regulator [Roseomonas sp. NPKOSM-4]